jgi:hypothetical protein
MEILKFIHVLIGVTMFGFIVAYYFYFIFAKDDPRARKNILRLSLFIDCLIFPFIILLFITGAHLMVNSHLSPAVPWVHMAFMMLGLVMFCWLISVAVKGINYYALRKGQLTFYGKRIFHTCHILMIILIVLIIHDAVSKSTFFSG